MQNVSNLLKILTIYGLDPLLLPCAPSACDVSVPLIHHSICSEMVVGVCYHFLKGTAPYWLLLDDCFLVICDLWLLLVFTVSLAPRPGLLLARPWASPSLLHPRIGSFVRRFSIVNEAWL